MLPSGTRFIRERLDEEQAKRDAEVLRSMQDNFDKGFNQSQQRKLGKEHYK